jgi:hypothetical protein
LFGASLPEDRSRARFHAMFFKKQDGRQSPKEETVSVHNICSINIFYLFTFTLKTGCFQWKETYVLYMLHLLAITAAIELAANRNNAKKKMHEVLLSIFVASFPAL